MKHFHIGEISRWKRIQPGIFAFEFVKETRNVKANFKSNGPVELWAEETLLCAAQGEFSLDVILPNGAELIVKADADTDVFIQMHAKQKVPQRTSDEIFTDLNPRKAPSDFERMMHIVQQNQRARDEVLSQEIKKVRAALVKKGQVIEETTTETTAETTEETTSETTEETTVETTE